MLNSETKRHIDAARQVLVGVVPNPAAQIDQITNALIYKFMDDMDQSSIKAGGEASFFIGDLERFSWSRIMDTKIGNQERMNLYTEALLKFSEAKHLPPFFREIFRSAFLPYRDPEVLGLFLKEIHYFDYSHSEELGNAYEYLLSIMSSQGDAGQFRTPRHIIDFIVKVVNPTKNDKVLDPACGTAGFLISAFKHILEQHDGKNPNGTKNDEKPLTPDERKKLMDNFEGYDIDPGMVRIAQVNMYLHKASKPKISNYDTLSRDERWGDKFDVILANPPFMSPKGGVRPHSKFSIKATRSEILFVDYIMTHLKPKGRAGIIVPEGVIFQSGTSYKQLRKQLVEDGLYAVVSLPSGVFNPYSGVKTSILFFDNEVSKRSQSILFVKIDSDGYDLGAQRRQIGKNNLPQAHKILGDYREQIIKDKPIEQIQVNIANSILASLVPKENIVKDGEYNLTADRYQENDTKIHHTVQSVKLDDLISLDFGVRITKKDNEGTKYPVFGGGGESFRTNTFNRENDEVVIARFAMSEKCVRFVKGPFYLLDSGFTYHLKNELVLKEYVDHILYNRQDLIYKCARGQAQKNIDIDQFKSISIPLPPIEIQEQVVDELNGYQKIITGAKQVIDNWKPVIKIDPEWKLVKLDRICNIFGGGTPSRTNRAYWGGNIPWISSRYFSDEHKIIGAEMITEEGLANSSAKIAPKGSTILITRVSVGKFAIADKDYAINQDLTALVPKSNNSVNAKYLWLISRIVADKIKKNAVGIGVTGVTRDFITRQEVPLPPLETQKQIVEIFEAEQTLIDSNKKLVEIYKQKINIVINRLWGE